MQKIIVTKKMKKKKKSINMNNIIDDITNDESDIENQNNLEARDYQIEVIDKLKKIYDKFDKFKLIWSCGLGKTRLSIYIVNVFKHKKILIGVPSVYLQKQFLKEILLIFPNEKNILCIGGDKKSTTNITQIQNHYEKNSDDPIFIITTYCSCYLIVNNFEFDFKIGDEAHHLVGIENAETKNYKLFHNIKSKKSLFMTATEKSINNKTNKETYSMNDVEKFGDYLDIKSVKWAIENKKITDYNLLVLSNSENEIDMIIKELNIEIKHKNLFVSAFMSLKAINDYNKLTHVLVCCNKTNNSDIIKEYVDVLLDKNIFTNIDKNKFYNNSLHTRKKINIYAENNTNEITLFKNSKYGIISSVYIFGEGFDLPKLNGVVFAENMTSDIRIVQTALRPNRIDPNDNKKISHIMIPYMESNDVMIDNQSFNRIRMIISKLRNVDDSIEQKISIKKIINKKSKSNDENNFNNEYKYEFEDENKELSKIKLRLIYGKALGSKNTEEQYEYNYVQQLNKELNINSKEMYTLNK